MSHWTVGRLVQARDDGGAARGWKIVGIVHRTIVRGEVGLAEQPRGLEDEAEVGVGRLQVAYREVQGGGQRASFLSPANGKAVIVYRDTGSPSLTHEEIAEYLQIFGRESMGRHAPAA